jgi:hypothetical protein
MILRLGSETAFLRTEGDHSLILLVRREVRSAHLFPDDRGLALTVIKKNRTSKPLS